MRVPRSVLSALLLAAGPVLSLPTHANRTLSTRQSSSDRLVFAHFMIGIVSDRHSASDYDDDMRRAKAIGIDAFALNIGTDDYTETQLNYAYDSAANNDMKVFISFDFNWYHPTSDAGRVGQLVNQYGSKASQLKVDGKVFVSSFAGDGLDVDAVRSSAGMDLFVAPNFHPGQGDFSKVDAAFNWMGWPSDGNNKAPKPGGPVVSVQDGDNAYISALGGKPYMAAVSPWFFTHFGAEVPYSKNWVFPGDTLWYDRWNQILDLKPNFVEIVTWNDYGESHYIGPLSSPHTDDGGSKWVNDMPHGGWLDMAIPYIKAYKAGSNDVSQFVDEDKIIYWYRRTPKDVNCDSTDTTMGSADNSTGNYFMGRPDGFDIMSDSVFVVPLLKEAGTVVVNSGGVEYTHDAAAGASVFSVDMNVGTQAFALKRGGQEVLSDTSLMPITSECPCGIYNFNAYVGTVPASPIDSLQPDGLSGFSKGLKASCDAQPTLVTGQAPQTQAPTSTVGSDSAPGTTQAPASSTEDSEPSSTEAPSSTDIPTLTPVPTDTCSTTVGSDNGGNAPETTQAPVSSTEDSQPSSTEAPSSTDIPTPTPIPTDTCSSPAKRSEEKAKRTLVHWGRFRVEYEI
ncbi:mutanase [Exidia glandulosa HHB12029]|uniref:Mutanase n=1 Tax=Exidia glandulosa HHB12029 TaxID=1314781 RepID=A0A165HAJ3_EXIGL|nr:mutanase [Exidia glandulosa HHB12029]